MPHSCAGAQFLNVIESVFSGMARAIIHNSDYPSLDAGRLPSTGISRTEMSIFGNIPSERGERFGDRNELRVRSRKATTARIHSTDERLRSLTESSRPCAPESAHGKVGRRTSNRQVSLRQDYDQRGWMWLVEEQRAGHYSAGGAPKGAGHTQCVSQDQTHGPNEVV